MAWLLLIVAGLLEIVWAISLQQADGFTRFWPSLIGIGVAVTSFVLLAMALKTLPVGTAYAVWVGIGALGVALFGTIFLGERVSAARVVFLALIVVGVAGLKSLRSEEHTSELQSLMRISYAVLCVHKKKQLYCNTHNYH